MHVIPYFIELSTLLHPPRAGFDSLELPGRERRRRRRRRKENHYFDEPASFGARSTAVRCLFGTTRASRRPIHSNPISAAAPKRRVFTRFAWLDSSPLSPHSIRYSTLAHTWICINIPLFIPLFFVLSQQTFSFLSFFYRGVEA